jgi:NTP pyrophosphatase (non-canonical NTP hydrolase)
MNEQLGEIMDITQEECAEVIQAISKIRRFGLTSVHNGESNQAHLEEEIGDLVCMIDLMIEHNMIDKISVVEASKRKRAKLAQWSGIEV